MKNFCRSGALVLALALLALPVMALPDGWTQAMVENDNLPPIDPAYLETLEGFHLVVGSNGITLADMSPVHEEFNGIAVNPGGIFGGEVETFNSNLVFEVTGRGPLEGWSRTLTIPAKCETHTAPRERGADVQSFETDMQRIEGRIRNDRDFEYFEVIAGTANGFPSPGHTKFFRQRDGRYLLDSTFNIKYQIRFKGAKGGKFDGIQDVVEGTVTMTAASRKEVKTAAK